MTTEYQNIVPAQILPLGLLEVYESTGVITIIDAFTMTNISPANVTVDVYMVPNGESSSEENRIIKNHILASEETYPFYELLAHTINAGGSIVVQTDTNAAVNLMISGRVITS